MTLIKHHHNSAIKRKQRVRSKMFGTASKPRLSVYRSNEHIYLQVINDQANQTLVSMNDKNLAATAKKKTKTEQAGMVAELIAQELNKRKIEAVIFDRGQYKYHGRVKAVAEALRSAGIQV